MRKNRQSSKQNKPFQGRKNMKSPTHAPKYFAPSGNKCQKKSMVAYVPALLKSVCGLSNQKKSVTELTRSSVFKEGRDSYMKAKTLTQAFEPKYFAMETQPCMEKRKQKGKKHKKSTQKLVKSGKERLSFNQKYYLSKEQKKGTQSISKIKKISSNDRFSKKDLLEAREQLQKQVRKSSSKPVISKAQFLTISSKYQSLLNKFMLTEVNPRTQAKCGQDYEENIEENLQLETMRQVQDETLKKGFNPQGFDLKLNRVKGMGIMDYQDEFMTHYDELSLSWKRDLKVQKRF